MGCCFCTVRLSALGLKMSEDMLLHFSSNSSNQSDQSLPTKIAKLEARMVGKAPSTAPAPASAPAQVSWPALSSAAKYGPTAATEDLAEPLLSSDSDDDVTGGSTNLLLSSTRKLICIA
ncbi:unnamed protein product [Thlaspi arvense]|uniref:Uncharacterized protein n=1 Tax=Thlaspi arvense TaxID=13288 RepID=A0AAU9RSP6_THLAR|nr:unnamed protein product [Thlaspi arvense]